MKNFLTKKLDRRKVLNRMLVEVAVAAEQAAFNAAGCSEIDLVRGFAGPGQLA